MTARVEVSVVLPTRNRAAFLGAALWSALNQEDGELEVIVVDDASTDFTAALLARETDPRLRVIHNRRRLGVAAARNLALQQATGEWLAFLDDDDLWAPRWLSTALDAAAGQGPALIYGARLIIDDARRACLAELAPDPATVSAVLHEYNAVGGPSAVIVHRDLVAQAGGFDERLSALADWEAWMRYAAAGQPVAVPDFLVGYTEYPDNMHRRDPFGVLEEFHRFQQIVGTLHGVDAVPPEAPFLRWLASDASELRHRWTAARLYARAARHDGSRDLARALRSLIGHGPRRAPAYATPAWLRPFGACREEPAMAVSAHA